MARNRLFNVLLFAGLCAVWVANVWLLKDITGRFGERPRSEAAGGEAAVSATSALVDSALRMVPAAAPEGFDGGTENPFRTVAEARLAASPGPRTKAPSAPRQVIVLKGILYKSNPLAILENAAGATSILGIGDTIQGQKVEAISKTSVKLRGKSGSCELSVKE
jgi:hypothetical protein